MNPTLCQGQTMSDGTKAKGRMISRVRTACGIFWFVPGAATAMFSRNQPCAAFGGGHATTRTVVQRREASTGERPLARTTGLRALTRQLLGTHAPANTPLMDAGLDSLAGTELMRRLGEQLRQELPATVLFDYPATGSIGEHLLGQQATKWPQQVIATDDEAARAKVDDVLARPRLMKPGARRVITSISHHLLGDETAADRPLMDAGLDSLASTELVRELAVRLGAELPATLLFDRPATRALSDRLSCVQQQATRSLMSACEQAHRSAAAA